MQPFTIKLKDRRSDECDLQDLEVKIDPGSKTTGICLSRTVEKTVNIVELIELEHRGQQIKMKLLRRSMYRRNRRQRKTRYRQKRFLNRTRKEGWLAPSLQHRIDSTMSWVKRLMKWSPVAMLAVERVKFDTQKMQNPEISGVEYQQGTLAGYEVREYLLEKWNRQCSYCGDKDIPLQIEHIVPKARGGSNRISNLCLACRDCNQEKSALPIEVFLADKPEVLRRVLAQAKRPLKDAAAVNAARNKLFSELIKTGLPVSTGTGAQTKMNRTKLKIPKTHAFDAACVGDIESVRGKSIHHRAVKCAGRGRYQRTLINSHGTPRAYLTRFKRISGFSSGDIVRVSHKRLGEFITKLVVRATGYFTGLLKEKFVSIPQASCRILQKFDGYIYGRCVKYAF